MKLFSLVLCFSHVGNLTVGRPSLGWGRKWGNLSEVLHIGAYKRKFVQESCREMWERLEEVFLLFNLKSTMIGQNQLWPMTSAPLEYYFRTLNHTSRGINIALPNLSEVLLAKFSLEVSKLQFNWIKAISPLQTQIATFNLD